MSATATGATSTDSLQPAISDDDWHFGITAPLWAPQIDVNVTVAGRQQTVNVSYNTLRHR